MADDTSFSSRAIREFHNALTSGSIFGVPRYTTALLPSVTNNQGGVAWDTTTNSLKVCDGSTWGAASATFSGGAITSSITTPVDVGYGVGVNGGFISQESAGVPDQSGFWTGTTSNAWIIAENADKAFNFAHAAATDPTLFIHSHNQNTGEWLSLSTTSTIGTIGGGASLTGIALALNGTNRVALNNGQFIVRSDHTFGFSSSSSDATVALDTTFARVSAGLASIPKIQINAAGTASAPSIAWTGDTNTGFWSSPSGNIFFTSGGTTRLGLNGSNLLLTSSGYYGWSSGAPDAAGVDTAMSRNSAGVVQIGTNGANASGRLRVADGTANSVGYGFSTDGDDTGMWLNGASNLCFSSANSALLQGNTTALRVKSTTQVNWSSGDPTVSGADVGFVRSGAGVVKVTDGSSGGTLFLDTTNSALKFGTGSDAGLVRVGAAALRISDGGSGPGALQTARSVEVNTGTKAPTNAESFEVYTNEGDGDGSIINLPTAVAGLTYTVVCQAAQTITINASAGDTIRMAASVSATAGLISTATVGNAVTLVAINATEWIAINYVGVVGVNWTVT